MNEPSVFQKLVKTFQVNNQQLKFGSYSAELSFYIIWAVVPLLLALANVIAILPFSEQEILFNIEQILPAEFRDIIIDGLEEYLAGTSSGIFSLGLIISLWPASNVFNTMQNLLNTIYKTKPRPNFIIARAFSYIFTLLMVIGGVTLGFVILFGSNILSFLEETFGFEIPVLSFILDQSWLIGILTLFLVMLFIYHLIPNVSWPIKYAVPGAIFATIGFVAISSLFPLYLTFFGGNVGSGTIGVIVVLIIWLYFNGFIFSLGAYVNVFFHDYKEKSYWKLLEETTSYRSFSSYSPGVRRYSRLIPGFRNKIYRDSEGNGEVHDIH